MRNKFDSLGKLIVVAGTEIPDRVQPEFAILSEEQLADCYVIAPDEALTAALPRGGWLGKITSRECLVEAFHEAPSVHDLRLCLQKQFNLCAHLRRESTRNKEPVREDPVPLWIISEIGRASCRERVCLAV